MSQEIRRRIAARRTGHHHTARELAFPHYALGAEQLPEDLPGKLHVGRFSEGHEALPETGHKEHIGRFSDGVEALPERAGEKAHVGQFADGAA
jgi:hypothetical protein